MIILHITDINNIKGNGVANAVSQYLKYEKNNNDVAVYNLTEIVKEDDVESFSQKDFNSIKSLPKPFNNPDVVIFNEVYKPKYIKLYKECLKNYIKYVIIPHGCLVDISQRRSALKKKIGNFVFFNKFIKNANALQFLNEYEYKHTNKFKYKRYIISGNGFNKNNDNFNKPKCKDLIFIGRYDVQHKGLDLIVEVCNKYREWFYKNNVNINLYGRDSVGRLEFLKKIIAQYQIEHIIKINGPVYKEEKENVLCEAYAFIHTSRWEGEPMGIIEALAYGLPCIVTDGTAFSERVKQHQCGYGSSFDVDRVFENIKLIYEDENKRDEMSYNAIKYIEKDFNWKKIIKKCIQEYENLL